MRTLCLLLLAIPFSACCEEDDSVSYTYDTVELAYSHTDTETGPVASGELFELTVVVPMGDQYAKKTCFSLIPKAHAMQECPKGVYRYPTISTLTITSDADYSPDYPAGTDLALPFGTYGSEPNRRFVPFVHSFREPPTAAKRHQFTVTVTYYVDRQPRELVAKSDVVVWE